MLTHTHKALRAHKMSRRTLGLGACALAITACTKSQTQAVASEGKTVSDNPVKDAEWANLSKQDWKARLTALEYNVLREEGTERPWTSEFNDNKAAGTYVCSGCELPIFKAENKYDSRTGWPSFFDVIEGSIETKVDNKIWAQRTEYHCKRCGGHQGHVFKDGPRPTGLRYCNNGVSLKFIEA